MFNIRPAPKDEVFCMKHNGTVQIVNERTVSWKISCQNCRYARNFGAAPLTARVKATTHAIQRRHVVEVIDSEGWSELVGNLDGTQTILF